MSAEVEAAHRPRVLLVHPGTQHAPRLAAELEREGLLFRYWTGYARSIGNGAGGKRRVDIPPEKLRTMAPVEMAALVLSRMGFPKERLWHLRNGLFQRLVPQCEIEAADVVIGFDTAAWMIGGRAVHAGKKFVLDQSVAHPLSRAGAVRAAGGNETMWPGAFVPRREDVRQAESWEHRLADAVVAASSFAKQTLVENGVPADKVRVIPYGVGEEWIEAGRSRRQQSRPAGRPYRFLYAGYVTPRKGVGVLLDAWREMDVSGAELRLAGGGRADAGNARNVVLLGQTSREDLLREMQDADAFVFPSLFEGFGLVLLEAMAAGLPVITTPNTAAPDLFEDGQEGLLVPAGDPKKLRLAMEGFLADPARARVMGERAHETAAQFTWRRYAAAYAGLLRQLHGANSSCSLS